MTGPPYNVDRELVLKSSRGEDIPITIMYVYSHSITPVFMVRIDRSTPYGCYVAILKLFDRRVEGAGRHKRPYNQQAEDAWQRCVRSGLAEKICKDRQDEFDKIVKARFRESDGADSSDDEDDDEEDEETDEEQDMQEWEADIYHDVRCFYRDEVRAYTKLKALQGLYVPRFLDTISLPPPPTAPQDLPSEYFETQGFLLQYIPASFPMTKLMERYPDQPRLWEEVVGQAVEVVTKVNMAGVIQGDNQPRNYVVSKNQEDEGFRVFVIDLAHSDFREEFKDTDDLDDENCYAYVVRMCQNYAGIALIMMMKVKRETGYKINVPWKDPYQALLDAKSQE